jgi:hypothetical protein
MADNVLEIMTERRAGLVIRRGDRYEFIHPDFREYLSAAALVQRYGIDPNRVWGRVICRWRNKNWRGVALFALGVLSDGNKDVTPLLKVILRQGVSGLYFSGTALADRVRVADDLANRIIDALVARARRTAASDLVRHPNALEVLSRLGAYPLATEGLLALARDETVDILVRRHAVRALERLRRVGKAIPILLTLARDKTADSGMRVDVATVLELWDQTDDAAPILLTLVREERAHFGFRRWVATWLGKLGRAQELLALARDESVDTLVRVVAAQELATFGDARLLPDLECIAQQDADEDVRQAVLVAVERIRQRL